MAKETLLEKVNRQLNDAVKNALSVQKAERQRPDVEKITEGIQRTAEAPAGVVEAGLRGVGKIIPGVGSKVEKTADILFGAIPSVSEARKNYVNAGGFERGIEARKILIKSLRNENINPDSSFGAEFLRQADEEVAEKLRAAREKEPAVVAQKEEEEKIKAAQAEAEEAKIPAVEEETLVKLFEEETGEPAAEFALREKAARGNELAKQLLALKTGRQIKFRKAIEKLPERKRKKRSV